MFRSKLKTIFLASAALFMAFSLIAFPQEAVSASLRGLDMWLQIVFPSLLPFFIVSEMLIGFGVVKFIGILLEPFMRPLFRVPGVGGFALAMGMASGYPAGAKLTARLRQEGQITKTEAERLVSFTNSSNPLFIFGAVSVGFFHNAKLGIILALAHYLGNLTVGLIMRFYGNRESKREQEKKQISIRVALSELHRTRIKDNRPIGKLLGDAVMSSVQTLLMIGGFIILFSVINKLLFHLHITAFFAEAFEIVLLIFHFPAELSIPFFSGLFEITLGSQLISLIQEATLMEQAIVTSLILGFCGFSVQAQVASILAQTDIDFKPFFFARIIHGLFAAFYTLILWGPVYERINENEQPSNTLPVSFLHEDSPFYTNMASWAELGSVITIAMLALYVVIYAKRMVFTKNS
ncbi:sporulation integral membrane protein YlbJ [Niallia endozanthoxylica]|uniref:Sporulation integral membrane protein YlbJ n=1 Tax=Niallia endozanthoxylica TaxID=2036016 RepID=A0A5J5HTX4_9BACI|nr:sporulation integral membrane protein YlbJ [Niallia endozanthoxylica]KAA9025986.1 sporulation integral membrane protein YlbJ [Niallia endozanthoxylica]